MPATTPTYGFPYPEDTDPTDVPGDIQALAEAVEADLASTNTALDARLDVLEVDTGWVTAGVVTAAGWTNSYCRVRKIRNVLYVEGYFVRSGAALTATSGNVADTTICTIPAGYRPATNDIPVYMQASLSGAGGRIMTTGVVTLMVAGANISTGDTVQFQAAYPAT